MLTPLSVKWLAIFACWRLACLTSVALGQTNAWPNRIQDLPDARRMFIEIYRVSCLQESVKSEDVEHAYLNLFMPFLQSSVNVWVNSALPTNRNNLSNEQVADALANQGGMGALLLAGKKISLDFLQSHQTDLALLASADLRNTNSEHILRGLRAIGTFRLNACFDGLLEFFRKDEKLIAWSATALSDLGDPRAIKPLIERFPDQPMKFFETLRLLYRGQRPDPLILKLLESDDAGVRWRAIYALGDCGNDELVPFAAKLMKDPSPEVREYAGLAAFNLSESGYAKLRSDVVSLLDDPSEQVRWHIGICVASRKRDPVCGKALLRLLRETEQGNNLLPSTIDCIERMTGAPLGYHADKPSSDPENKAALDRFAKWIAEQK